MPLIWWRLTTENLLMEKCLSKPTRWKGQGGPLLYSELSCQSYCSQCNKKRKIMRTTDIGKEETKHSFADSMTVRESTDKLGVLIRDFNSAW